MNHQQRDRPSPTSSPTSSPTTLPTLTPDHIADHTADLIADNTADPRHHPDRPHCRPHRRPHRRPHTRPHRRPSPPTSRPTITAALRARKFRALAAMLVAGRARPRSSAVGMAGATRTAASSANPRGARPSALLVGRSCSPAVLGLCSAPSLRRQIAPAPSGRWQIAASAPPLRKGLRACVSARPPSSSLVRGAPRGGVLRLRRALLPLPCLPPRRSASRSPQLAWRQGRGNCALAMPP